LKLSYNAEYCGTPQSKERSNGEYKVCPKREGFTPTRRAEGPKKLRKKGRKVCLKRGTAIHPLRPMSTASSIIELGKKPNAQKRGCELLLTALRFKAHISQGTYPSERVFMNATIAASSSGVSPRSPSSSRLTFSGTSGGGQSSTSLVL